MGPPGKNGLDAESTQWHIVDVVVDRWYAVNDDLMGDIFESGNFKIPELTQFVYDVGAVMCYMSIKLNNSFYQTPLPYTFYGMSDDGVLYSENYTFEMTPGNINFIVKINDFDTKSQEPLICNFRVVLMW